MTERVPKNPRARWAWIKLHLILRGATIGDVANELGVTPWAVYKTARKPYPRVERALAARFGLKARDLFPERYDPTGAPKITERPGRPDSTTAARRCNGKPPSISSQRAA